MSRNILDDLETLDDDQQARLDRAFREIETRQNPQHGPGPDEIAEDLWQLARLNQSAEGGIKV